MKRRIGVAILKNFSNYRVHCYKFRNSVIGEKRCFLHNHALPLLNQNCQNVVPDMKTWVSAVHLGENIHAKGRGSGEGETGKNSQVAAPGRSKQMPPASGTLQREAWAVTHLQVSMAERWPGGGRCLDSWYPLGHRLSRVFMQHNEAGKASLQFCGLVQVSCPQGTCSDLHNILATEISFLLPLNALSSFYWNSTHPLKR